MSELSVTEIQKALREHANFGHDVLSDRHNSIIRGKPHGMRLGTSLIFSRIGDATVHRVDSDLMQSERPVITNVNSYLGHDGERITNHMLRVYPVFPTIEEFDDKTFHRFSQGNPSDLSRPELATHDRQLHEYHEADANRPKDDIHKVLEAHKTDQFPAFGVHTSFRGKTDNNFVAVHSGLLMPQDAGKFKMSEGLARLTHPFKPGSNLIKVAYSHTMAHQNVHAPWRHYEYDPEHETLKEMTDYKDYDERP